LSRRSDREGGFVGGQSGRAGLKDEVARAGRLRQEMTMTLYWIAKRLNMGAVGFLANLLREARRKRKYAIMRD
jgi:hypothetical protein